MAVGWTAFPLALCASCIVHGAAIVFVDGVSRSEAATSATSSARLTVLLGGGPLRPGAMLAVPGPVRSSGPPSSFGIPLAVPSVAEATVRGNDKAAPIPPPYLVPAELDLLPQPQGELDFARAMPGQDADRGHLVLVVFIDALGQVEKVDIEKSDLPDVFAASAVDTLRSATFSPGEKDGRPAKSRIRMEISYD